MNGRFIEEETYEGLDFYQKSLEKGVYEDCRFVGCNFPGCDLSEISFIECEFSGCDLSMTRLSKTALRDVIFKNCKLLGLQFQDCNEMLFSVKFEACQLKLSSFFGRAMKNTDFINCNLTEVDFTDADLSSSVFDNCDFSAAIFEQTVLEKCNFRTSCNYSIDPEQNRIKKAKFSANGLSGLLQKYDIDIVLD